MKTRSARRSILHIDLDPFFVSVERSLDPALRGRPVVVGGEGGSDNGIVAAASAEARRAGVKPGLLVSTARRLCPEAAFRRGDLETYARVSQEVTTVLLGASRRVERPSADEAFVELTLETPGQPHPAATAERIKDELQRRLGLDAAFGVASSRLAAQVASGWARPRGLVVVLPGYEASFLASQKLERLPDLPPHLESALAKAGYETLGQLAEAGEDALAPIVGPAAAALLTASARGLDDEPVRVATPPTWIQEEAQIRARGSDREALAELLDGLVSRAWRRLRPFDLLARTLTVEVRRAEGTLRRASDVAAGFPDEGAAREAARALADPLLEPSDSVRALQVRFSRLGRAVAQTSLFPAAGGASR